jgi:hypothetical protein
MIKNCKQCGKEYTIKPYRKNTSFFCSNKCYGKSIIGKPSWNKGLPKEKQPGYGKHRKIKDTSKMGKADRNGEKNPNYGKRGKETSNYKGGKYKSKTGYVFILLPESHLAKKDGYVAEHRLVAEQCLGRLLSKIEIVHHINGIKDDNRPENLYLFKNNGEHISFHNHPYIIKSNI